MRKSVIKCDKKFGGRGRGPLKSDITLFFLKYMNKNAIFWLKKKLEENLKLKQKQTKNVEKKVEKKSWKFSKVKLIFFLLLSNFLFMPWTFSYFFKFEYITLNISQ